jgi:hypothetical protein
MYLDRYPTTRHNMASSKTVTFINILVQKYDENPHSQQTDDPKSSMP